MIEVFKHWRHRKHRSLICRLFHKKWLLGWSDCRTRLFICYKCDRTFEEVREK